MEDLQRLYDDFTRECHEMATDLAENYLSIAHFMDAAVSVGAEWDDAKKWIEGGVV